MVEILARMLARTLPAWFERRVWRPFFGGGLVLAVFLAMAFAAWGGAARSAVAHVLYWPVIALAVVVAGLGIKVAGRVVDELCEGRRNAASLRGSD